MDDYAELAEVALAAGLRSEFAALLQERDGLRAARLAYASEFALDAEGYPDIGSVHQNIRALKVENAALLADKQRLDWLDKNCTRVSDSERYLPKHVYWGGGSHKNVRSAIDAAMSTGQQGE